MKFCVPVSLVAFCLFLWQILLVWAWDFPTCISSQTKSTTWTNSSGNIFPVQGRARTALFTFCIPLQYVPERDSIFPGFCRMGWGRGRMNVPILYSQLSIDYLFPFFLFLSIFSCKRFKGKVDDKYLLVLIQLNQLQLKFNFVNDEFCEGR